MKAAGAAAVPQEWKGKLSTGGSTLWLTPDEAQQLQQAISRLVDPYVERWHKPETRPADGRPVRLFHTTYLTPYTEQP
ncbi:hypothetical protein [Nonomuraea aridisoli]|uniref:Uncharacterized protein n=1 Tax=Nonomuraea aridisoli TaxID=2070368 RepID=A0A2W2E3U9_9ACTN|nr:hypothetical protein [Nonomuraea aridisoli]PZG17303.1 hypothetical protein C1J01_18430 [Nonomuraea aridisoli]